LSQTYEDFEVIVIDDASPVSLESVCSAFNDLRVQYYRNEVNCGVAVSRNRGIEVAKGRYVSFLDSDDTYLPTRLVTLSSRIHECQKAPEILFHRQRRNVQLEQHVVSPSRLPDQLERLDEYILLHGNFIQTNTFVVVRELALSIRFDPAFRIYEDTKFLLECWLAASSYQACEEVLSVYNDFTTGARLSKAKLVERMQPMLHFSQQKCSSAAAEGLGAFVAAEIPLARHPLRVLAAIWRGWRAGVPGDRSVLYLARSLFGSTIADRIARSVLLRRERARQVTK
jgi:glycosyltransferase involved in cell wall biosynthesis